jgi:hypothetical protein
MPQHSTLADSEIHYCKHITTATTADAGKVITPSSATNGISTLRKITTAELNDTTFDLYRAYGGKTIKNNATVINRVAAVDATFNTASDFTQVTGIWQTPDVAPVLNTTQQTNTFTIGATGIYEINWWGVVSSSMANTEIAFNFGVNGAVSTDRPVIAHVTGANDRGVSAAHAQALLPAGSVLSMWLGSTVTANITIHQGRASVSLLQRTA